MLDSALQTKQHKDIDWIFVQKAINKWLSRALFWWVLFIIFATPLIVFSGTYSLSANRMLFFSFGAWFGWGIYIARDLFSKDRILFGKSVFIRCFIILFFSVVSVFIVKHGVFMQDAVNPLGPIAWISLSLFCILVWQIKNISISVLFRAAVAGFFILFLFYIISFFALPSATFKAAAQGAKNSVSTSSNISISRFINQGFSGYLFFGAGLGNGKRAFWNTAEQADLESLSSELPPIGGAYARILWDGGLLLFIAFLCATFGIVIGILYRAKRLFPKLPLRSKEREIAKRTIWLSMFALLWLFFLWFKTLSFLVLYITFLFILFLEIYSRRCFDQKNSFELAIIRFDHNSFLLKIFRCVLVFIMVLIVYLAFIFASPKPEWFGPAMYSVKAESIVKDISENQEIFIFNPSKATHFFEGLKECAYSVDLKNISPEIAWSFARSFGKAAYLSSILSDDFNSNEWILLAKDSYDSAILGMPNNIILLTEAANFYRVSIKDEKAIAQAISFLDAAIRIDPAYIPARMEKASIYIAQEKNDKALEEIEPYVKSSAEIAYSAGTLCTQMGNFEKAVEYYILAISQNEKHLQARFELAQALVALGKINDAIFALNELESFVAKDDADTLSIIKQLREMIEK